MSTNARRETVRSAEAEDLVGAHLLHLLNEGALEKRFLGSIDETIPRALLSSRNLRRLRRRARMALEGGFGEWWSGRRWEWRESLVFLGVVWIVGGLGLCISSCHALVSAWDIGWRGLAVLLAILLDWEDVLYFCPRWVLGVWEDLGRSFKVVDDLMLGVELGGREWKEEEAEKRWMGFMKEEGKMWKEPMKDDNDVLYANSDVNLLLEKLTAEGIVSGSTEHHRRTIEFAWVMLRGSADYEKSRKEVKRSRLDCGASLKRRKQRTACMDKKNQRMRGDLVECRNEDSSVGSNDFTADSGKLKPKRCNNWEEDRNGKMTRYQDSDIGNGVCNNGYMWKGKKKESRKNRTYVEDYPVSNTSVEVEALDMLDNDACSASRGRPEFRSSFRLDDDSMSCCSIDSSIISEKKDFHWRKRSSSPVSFHFEKFSQANSDSSVSTLATTTTNGSCRLGDLTWVDVGTRIGMRLLNPDLQTSQTEKDMVTVRESDSNKFEIQLTGAMQKVEGKEANSIPPVHPIWSPHATTHATTDDISVFSAGSAECFSNMCPSPRFRPTLTSISGYLESQSFEDSSTIEDLLEIQYNILSHSQSFSVDDNKEKLQVSLVKSHLKVENNSTPSLCTTGMHKRDIGSLEEDVLELTSKAATPTSTTSGKEFKFNAMDYLPASARFTRAVPKALGCKEDSPKQDPVKMDSISRDSIKIPIKRDSIKIPIKQDSTNLDSIKKTITDPIKINSTFQDSIRIPIKRDSTKRVGEDAIKRRSILLPGVKIAVPIFPYSAMKHHKQKRSSSWTHQMASVLGCKRIHVPGLGNPSRHIHRKEDILYQGTAYFHSRYPTNCLAIHLQLDKCYLRNGTFSSMHIRIPDQSRYMPRHSKYPIGSCVATSFGVGVLVGWRVEDDCHVIRSLWQKRGHGSALAYLNRDALHGVVDAAVGFYVVTPLGQGKVLAYVRVDKKYLKGRYFVLITETGRHKGHVVELTSSDILSCPSAKFIPVVEHVREAAQFRIQVDNYRASKKPNHNTKWSDEFDIVFAALVKAIGENPDLDQEMRSVVTSLIDFLESLDIGQTTKSQGAHCMQPSQPTQDPKQPTSPTSWFKKDLFKPEVQQCPTPSHATPSTTDKRDSYTRIFSIIRTLSRALAIARSDATSNRPNFQLALSTINEILIFLRSVIKVHKKNLSQTADKIRKRTIQQVKTTLVPIKNHIERIGQGLMERLYRNEAKARLRFQRFVDFFLHDELMLRALECSDWKTCLVRLERGIVKANILDKKSCSQYRKSALFLYNDLAPKYAGDNKQQQIAWFAKALEMIATPKRSILKILSRDDVLELFERILVRVFRNNSDACQTLNTYSSTFYSFRHIVMLKNVYVVGKLWIPLLDAANEELAWAVTRMPHNTKEFLQPISKLFSLGVASIRELMTSESTGDWMDFLMKDEAVHLIQELDMKLVLSAQTFCNELKETMVILPYYPTIDQDILNLIDEADLNLLLREAAEAIVDFERFGKYIKAKSALAIHHFLKCLPKMSIPVERRDLGDGWILTCRGKDGGDLALSDVQLERHKLVCEVMGSDNVLSPYPHVKPNSKPTSKPNSKPDSKLNLNQNPTTEVSVINDIKELILNAQKHGCWATGVGGVDQDVSPAHANSPLDGIPLSQVLSCSIELWRNLEIDDDELMEIAIRDVSYQIQLQKQREEDGISPDPSNYLQDQFSGFTKGSLEIDPSKSLESVEDFDTLSNRRFNPRVNPTLLYLEMQGMTFLLDDFLFRVERKESKPLFDPVFEGRGNLSVKNVFIRLRVECRKERIAKMDAEITVPVLQLQELEVRLDEVFFEFKDTGLDWILNRVVSGFSDAITEIVQLNLKEQIISQIHITLEHINAFIEVNPDLMLSVLGITIDDLEENIVWV